MSQLKRKESLFGGPAAEVNLPQVDETSEDGPVFRATLNDLEKNVHGLKKKLKQILRCANVYLETFKTASLVEDDFLQSMKGLNSLVPATTYLEQALGSIKVAREDYLHQLETLLLLPLKSMYENDLAQIDEKKKKFDKESSEYYGYQEKYLAMDKEKIKKKNSQAGNTDKDKKYQQKSASFNLLRFDYLTYMEELNTKKQQELLYHVSSFAEKQHRYFGKCSKSLEVLKPQLDELSHISTSSWSEISNWIKDRQNMRKNLEVSTNEALDKSPIEKASLTEKESKYRGIRDLDFTVDTSAKPTTEVKEGFLFTQNKQGNWKQVWCVLADGWFLEYPSWKIDANSKPPKKVDIRTCTPKVAFKAERRFCFELITPASKKIYQASSEEDLKTWLFVIQKAIETSLEQYPNPHHSNLNSHSPDPTWLRNEVSFNTAGNQLCADCGSADPDWCSINLGILVCKECSGIHRSLGTHISKVRSITLDTSSWTHELVMLQKAIGNQIANSIWEANLPPDRKPTSQSKREEKLNFIKEKYCNRAFIDREKDPDSNSTINPNELLLTSLANNNITNAIKALALGADVNCLSSIDSETQGKGPLHIAIINGNIVCAELILQNHADVDLQDHDLCTALHYASEKDDELLINYLVGKGANKEIKNKEGVAALEKYNSGPSSPTMPFSPISSVPPDLSVAPSSISSVFPSHPSSFSSSQQSSLSLSSSTSLIANSNLPALSPSQSLFNRPSSPFGRSNNSRPRAISLLVPSHPPISLFGHNPSPPPIIISPPIQNQAILSSNLISNISSSLNSSSSNSDLNSNSNPPSDLVNND